MQTNVSSNITQTSIKNVPGKNIYHVKVRFHSEYKPWWFGLQMQSLPNLAGPVSGQIVVMGFYHATSSNFI